MCFVKHAVWYIPFESVSRANKTNFQSVFVLFFLLQLEDKLITIPGYTTKSGFISKLQALGFIYPFSVSTVCL